LRKEIDDRIDHLVLVERRYQRKADLLDAEQLDVLLDQLKILALERGGDFLERLVNRLVDLAGADVAEIADGVAVNLADALHHGLVAAAHAAGLEPHIETDHGGRRRDERPPRQHQRQAATTMVAIRTPAPRRRRDTKLMIDMPYLRSGVTVARGSVAGTKSPASPRRCAAPATIANGSRARSAMSSSEWRPSEKFSTQKSAYSAPGRA
jgi:hypothetical protein